MPVWPARAAMVAGLVLGPVAHAAPSCVVGPIEGLFSESGAEVTMAVANTGAACGAPLWVQAGVIPFTVLRALRIPRHGRVVLRNPGQFSYIPHAGYRGQDRFEVIARGNDHQGATVTGVLRVTVTVTPPGGGGSLRQ